MFFTKTFCCLESLNVCWMHFALQRTCLLHGPPGRRLIQGDGWAETTVGSGLFCTSTLHQNGENQNDWKSMTAWCWKPVHQDLTPVHTSSQVCVRFVWQRGSNEAKVNELLSREARFPHVKPFVTAVVLGARPWVFRIARAFLFFLKKGTKSCDFGEPVTPSTWGYFKLYLMDFMPQRRQKEIRIWIQPMELERCVLFFVLQIARTNKKPASLQITEHSLLKQNCWVMRGVALFPRVSWGFAKSLLGRLLARSLEWQRQTSPSYQSWTKRTEKTFRKKNQVLSTYLSKQRNYIAWTSAGKLVTWTAVRIDLVAIWEICQDDFTLMPIPCNFLLDWKCMLTGSCQDHCSKLSIRGGSWTSDGKNSGMNICNHYCYMEWPKSMFNAS